MDGIVLERRDDGSVSIVHGVQSVDGVRVCDEYDVDGVPTLGFEHIVPDVDVDSLGMEAVDALVTASMGNAGILRHQVFRHHDYPRVLKHVALAAADPDNNVMLPPPGAARSFKLPSSRGAAPAQNRVSTRGRYTGRGGVSLVKPASMDTRLGRLLELVGLYGPNAVTLFERGLSDDASIDLLHLVGFDGRTTVQMMPVWYSMIHCKHELRHGFTVDSDALALGDGDGCDSVDGFERHCCSDQMLGMVPMVMQLNPDDPAMMTPGAKTSKDFDSCAFMPDYPVFTDDSIRILNTIGGNRVLELLGLINRVRYTGERPSKLRLYRVMFDVLGRGGERAFHVLETVVREMMSNALPVVPSDGFDADWVIRNSGLPDNVFTDMLRSGAFVTGPLDGMRDAFTALVERILEHPSTDYASLMTLNDSVQNDDAIIVRNVSGASNSSTGAANAVKQVLDNAYDADGAAGNPVQSAMMMMCMKHRDGASRLLYRFAGMVAGLVFLDYSQLKAKRSRTGYNATLEEYQSMQLGEETMLRVNRMMQTLCETDDGTFTALLSIPVTPVPYETYVQAITGIPDSTAQLFDVMRNDCNTPDPEREPYTGLFPCSLNRMLDLLETALGISDHNVNTADTDGNNPSTDGDAGTLGETLGTHDVTVGITRLNRLMEAETMADNNTMILMYQSPRDMETVGKRNNLRKLASGTSKPAFNALWFNEEAERLTDTDDYDDYYDGYTSSKWGTDSMFNDGTINYEIPEVAYDQWRTPASSEELRFITEGEPFTTVSIPVSNNDGGITVDATVTMFPDMGEYRSTATDKTVRQAIDAYTERRDIISTQWEQLLTGDHC